VVGVATAAAGVVLVLQLEDALPIPVGVEQLELSPDLLDLG